MASAKKTSASSSYLRCLDAITPYAYPRLKQVTWQPPNELPDGRAPDNRFEPKLEDDREPMPACKDRRTGAELEQ
jgi:hypothetical protein